MRRHAPTYSALLLVVLLAALSLFAIPAVGATAVEIATVAGEQAAEPETAIAAPQAPATVHRGSASSTHSVRLPFATDSGGDPAHLSRPGATGAKTTAGDELGRRATITVQGRAPPEVTR